MASPDDPPRFEDDPEMSDLFHVDDDTGETRRFTKAEARAFAEEHPELFEHEE
jgi:hypothetical protein